MRGSNKQWSLLPLIVQGTCCRQTLRLGWRFISKRAAGCFAAMPSELLRSMMGVAAKARAGYVATSAAKLEDAHNCRSRQGHLLTVHVAPANEQERTQNLFRVWPP